MKTYNPTDYLTLARTQSSSANPLYFSPQVSFSAAEKAAEADQWLNFSSLTDFNIPNDIDL